MPIIKKHDHATDGAGDQPTRMVTAVSEVLTESDNARYIEPVLQVLRAIAESKDDERVYESVKKGDVRPEYLVLADIIGNTICADLLDYIKRDHSMTGIKATYDSRIFRYFGVNEHNGYQRVVIQLVKNGRIRNDALADLLDILKLRYNLSDKVLFHPKKCAADAMLIRAISSSGLSEQDLMRFSDDGLLDTLRDLPLISMIRKWSLFKAVFVCGKSQINTFDDRLKKDDLIAELHRNEKLRQKIESRVKQEAGLPAKGDSVLLFCPSPKMTLKSVRALVIWKDGTVRRLNEIGKEDDPLVNEQVGLLQDIYPQLWRLYLFCEPSLRSHGKRLQDAFSRALETEARLSATCDPALRHYLEKGCKDYGLGMLLDREVDASSEVRGLSASERNRVRLLSHAQIPTDPYSDEFADQSIEVLASSRNDPRLQRRLRKIVRTALEKRKLAKRRSR
jgi:hypothetical protein